MPPRSYSAWKQGSGALLQRSKRLPEAMMLQLRATQTSKASLRRLRLQPVFSKPPLPDASLTRLLEVSLPTLPA